MQPIWKDYIVNLDEATGQSAADAIDYAVALLDSGTVIYTGRAMRRPGAAHIPVCFNDICRPYLVAPRPRMEDGAFTPYVLPWFRIDVGDEQEYDDVQYLPDWSYDYGRTGEEALLSAPINGRVDPRQLLPVTVCQQAQVSFSLTYTDGTTETVTVQIAHARDFSDDFSADFATSEVRLGTGTAVLDLATRPGLAAVSVLGQTYAVAQPCHDYALLYRNAFGGWDTFLLEGSVVPADGYDRRTMTRAVDNVDPTTRARHNYLTEVTQRWTMRTGWLHDDEVARLHHLTGSTDVYLYNIATGDLVPVVLTSGEAVYKTYKTNGRQPGYYELTAERAQGRERR